MTKPHDPQIIYTCGAPTIGRGTSCQRRVLTPDTRCTLHPVLPTPPTVESAEEMLTPGRVAEMFNVDAKTVTRWSRAGRLTATKTLGGHRRFRRVEVEALLVFARENTEGGNGL